MQTGNLLYAGAVCLGLLFIVHNEESSSRRGGAATLHLSIGKNGNYLSQAQEVTENDIRFFGEDSQIEKYYYIGEGSGIHVLALTCGQKINSVHPASHCLRSSGWTIESEDIYSVSVADEHSLYVGEILAEYQNTQCLFWVWYTNAEFSTPSFVHFRKEWDRDEIWHTYQVMVPLDDTGAEGLRRARKELRFFLKQTLQGID